MDVSEQHRNCIQREGEGTVSNISVTSLMWSSHQCWPFLPLGCPHTAVTASEHWVGWVTLWIILAFFLNFFSLSFYGCFIDA